MISTAVVLALLNLIQSQAPLWARNCQIPWAGSFCIRGGLILGGSDHIPSPYIAQFNLRESPSKILPGSGGTLSHLGSPAANDHGDGSRPQEQRWFSGGRSRDFSYAVGCWFMAWPFSDCLFGRCFRWCLDHRVLQFVREAAGSSHGNLCPCRNLVQN